MSKSSLSLNENVAEKEPPSVAQQSPMAPHYITPPCFLVSTVSVPQSAVDTVCRNSGSGVARMLLGLNLSHFLVFYHVGGHAFLIPAGFLP